MATTVPYPVVRSTYHGANVSVLLLA